MRKSLLTLTMTLVAVVSFAYDVKINGVCYNLDNKNNTTGVTKSEEKYFGDVVIPKQITVDGARYSVTSIGDYAFSECRTLTSVIIPNSVTYIGKQAFAWCEGLTTVEIPNSVTSIGMAAFARCEGLTSVTIPQSVTSMSEFAFYGCKNLTSVAIPKSVTNINGNAFWGCSSLISLVVDGDNKNYYSKDNVLFNKEKTELMFCVTTKTGSYNIPSSVTSIRNYAFYGCSGLTSVTIGNSVTRIGNYAFYSCSGLTSVTIPNSVTSIGESAFMGCKSLTNLTLGSGLRTMENDAFNRCEKLEKVICYAENLQNNSAFGGDEIHEPHPDEVECRVISDSNVKHAILIVPDSLIEKYQNNDMWKKFTIKGVSDYTPNEQK